MNIQVFTLNNSRFRSTKSYSTRFSSSIFTLNDLANTAKKSFLSWLHHLTSSDLDLRSSITFFAFTRSCHLHSQNRISFVLSFNATISISLSLCHHLPILLNLPGYIFLNDVAYADAIDPVLGLFRHLLDSAPVSDD